MLRAFLLVAFLVSTSSAVYTFVRVRQIVTHEAQYLDPGAREPMHRSVGRALKGIGGQFSRAMGPVVFWGIVALMASLVLFVGFGQWLRWRKGALRFSIREKVFHPTDTIQGTLVLHAKQPIVCHKVTVTLRCLVDSGSGNHGRERVVYDDPHVVLGETTIPAGARRQMSFTVVLPEKVADSYKQIGEQLALTGTLGQLARGVLTMASKVEALNARWELLAEVDAEGVDLSEVRRLVVKRAA